MYRDWELDPKLVPKHWTTRLNSIPFVFKVQFSSIQQLYITSFINFGVPPPSHSFEIAWAPGSKGACFHVFVNMSKWDSYFSIHCIHYICVFFSSQVFLGTTISAAVGVSCFSVELGVHCLSRRGCLALLIVLIQLATSTVLSMSLIRYSPCSFSSSNMYF